MNRLAREKQLEVLAALVDGNSERAVERMTTVNRLTISRLALRLGEGAQRLHNSRVRDLGCHLIEVDEIWSFVAKKQARVTAADPAEFGEAYTFVALDKASRLVVSFRVGKRDEESTKAFIADLRSRLAVVPTITSDGWLPYISAIGESFGPGVDYAQTVKDYRSKGRRNGGDDHRYEPPRDPFIVKRTIFGAPDLETASTAYVERQNGTMRHFIGRMRRLCLAFSKRLEPHRASCALAYCHYNFCHVVKTLRVTPAMQAGLTDHVWTLEEFFDAVISAAPCDAPIAKPLEHPTPATTARALPAGRGFLRVVRDNDRPPDRRPPSAPKTPATQAAPPPPTGPREAVQLRLFDDRADDDA